MARTTIFALMVLQQSLLAHGASTTAADGDMATTTMMDMATTMAPATTMMPATTMASSGATTTTTDGGTPATVVFTLTIANIDLAALQADSAAQTLFENSIISTVASTLSGIEASMISVSLSAGSVVVTTTITVPSDMTGADVGAAVETASSGSLAGDVTSGLSAISAITAIATGDMTAVVSEPTVTEAVSGGGDSSSSTSSTGSSDSDIADGAWPAAGGLSFTAAVLATAVLA